MAVDKIDRSIVTPFLLRVFYRQGQFHRTDEFSGPGSLPQHVQIYTWKSCTLRELTSLLTSALPDLVPSSDDGSRIIFRLTFPDTRESRPNNPRFIIRDVGSVTVGGGRRDDDNEEGKELADDVSGDADKTLEDANFMIGDFLTATIFAPGEAPSLTTRRGEGMQDFNGGRSGYRQNGFGSQRRADRYNDRGVPPGEWRRGDVPPARDNGYGQGRNSRGRGRSFY